MNVLMPLVTIVHSIMPRERFYISILTNIAFYIRRARKREETRKGTREASESGDAAQRGGEVRVEITR